MPLNSFISAISQVHPDRSRELIDNLARTPLSQVVLLVVILTFVRAAMFPFLKNTPLDHRGAAYGLARFFNEGLDAFIYAGVFVFLLIRPFGVQAFLIPSGSMWSTLHVNDFIVANKAVYRFSDPKFQDIVVFRPPSRAVTDPTQRDPNGDVKVDFIKRCIGLPGDVIELKQGQLIRNGQRVPEPYKEYSECTDMPRGQECQDFRPLTAGVIDHMTKASFKLVKYKGQVIPLNYTDRDANSPSPAGNYSDLVSPYYVAEEYQLPDPAVEQELMHAPAARIPQGYYLMMGDNRNGSFDSRGWGLVPRASIIGRSEFVWLPISRWQVTR